MFKATSQVSLLDFYLFREDFAAMVCHLLDSPAFHKNSSFDVERVRDMNLSELKENY